MYIHDSLSFKCRVSINRINIKKFKKHRSVNIYRPPDGDIKACNTFLKEVYFISLKSNKLFYVTGDSKLNVIDCNKKEKVT